MDLRRPQYKMSKNPLSVSSRRHFSCSFPSGTSSSCLYLTVILKFLISRTMCKLKLKEIILYFSSSKVQLLSKNSSRSFSAPSLCIPAGARVLSADTPSPPNSCAQQHLELQRPHSPVLCWFICMCALSS